MQINHNENYLAPELSREQCREMGRLCMFHNLRRVTRMVTSFYDAVFRDNGLNAAQFTILAVVCAMDQNDEGCAMVPLAATLGMDVSTLTRNIAVLKRMELVYVKPGQDKRVRRVRLTELGSSHLAQTYHNWHKAQQTMLDQLGDESFEQLLTLLHQVRRSNLGKGDIL